jgi:hypothetical protein
MQQHMSQIRRHQNISCNPLTLMMMILHVAYATPCLSSYLCAFLVLQKVFLKASCIDFWQVAGDQANQQRGALAYQRGESIWWPGIHYQAHIRPLSAGRVVSASSTFTSTAPLPVGTGGAAWKGVRTAPEDRPLGSDS